MPAVDGFICPGPTNRQGAFVGTAAELDRTAAAELCRCGAAAAEQFGAAGSRGSWNSTPKS